MIRVLTCGGFQNRNPLAYAPFQRRLASDLGLVDRPEAADLLLISHHLDLELFGVDLYETMARHRHLRLVLLSEEPFWDVGWAPDPFGRDQVYQSPRGPLTYRVLNHQNTRIFHTEHVPYFLLTDPRYLAHYRPLLGRNAGLSVAQWMAHFRNAPLDAAFMGEKRLAERDRIAFPDQDVWALSLYRTRFAQLCDKGRVLRLGKGWVAGPPRLELSDWHANKLERLDRQCRYLGAFENTHQRDYVSEKIFDAFAIGAIPLYFAAPDHAVHRLVGTGSWLNFHVRPPVAAAFDPRRPVTLAEAEAYAAVQHGLASRFGDPALVRADIDRVCATLLAELRQAVARR